MRMEVEHGENNSSKLKENLSHFYTKNIPGSKVDYIEIVHPENINILEEVDGPALCAVAVQVGKARLIDNLKIKV